jgi:hypothetical protein
VRRINHTIHLKYLTPDALNVPRAASYLSKGDEVTLKIHMDRVISWNIADSSAGKAIQLGGLYRLLEG